MRVNVPSDNVVLVLDLTSQRDKGFVIRPIDGGVTFFLATGNPTELMSVDDTGIPVGGIPLDTTMPPFSLNFFADKIYARASAAAGLDVQTFNNR